MARAIPVLRILDEAEARSFYIDWLAFAVDWEWRHGPEFPIYLSVSRDGLSLHLTQYSGDAEPGGAVYFEVEDVNALYREIKARRPALQEAPTAQAWGMTELLFRDPFDNRLRFASPTGD